MAPIGRSLGFPSDYIFVHKHEFKLVLPAKVEATALRLCIWVLFRMTHLKLN